jgi:hypothetical protein
MKVLILILIKFFLISALFIVSNENLHLGDPMERETFFDAYSTWLGNIFNQSKEIVGSVINLKWLPDEASPPT